jgi:hypothetical protein
MNKKGILIFFLIVFPILLFTASTYAQEGLSTRDYEINEKEVSEFKSLLNNEQKDHFENLTLQEKKELIFKSSNLKVDEEARQDFKDYYKYYEPGSVYLEIDSNLDQTVSGSTLNFSGKIINQNDYPVVNGSVYVRIIKEQEGEGKSKNKNQIVDQFFAEQDIDLAANDEQPITIDWKVPDYATTSNYKAVFYLIFDKKFNFLNVPPSSQMMGVEKKFRVEGQINEKIYLDGSSIFLNNEKALKDNYDYLPIFKDKNIHFKTDLVNQTNIDQSIPVEYRIYCKNNLNKENLIKTETVNYNVSSNSKKEINYDIKDAKHSFYVIEAEVEHKDVKSIVNAKFLRKDKSGAWLGFTAVDYFPLKKDQEATIFSVFGKYGTIDSKQEIELELNLKNEEGNTIYSNTFKDKNLVLLNNVEDKFVPKKNYDKFTLEAKIYSKEKIIDQTVANYDCQKINPDLCQNKNEKIQTASSSENTKNSLIKTLLVVAVFLVIVLGVVFILRKKRGASMKNLFFIIFLPFSVFIVQSNLAEAKISNLEEYDYEPLYFHYNEDDYPTAYDCINNTCSNWMKSEEMDRFKVKIFHETQVVNLNTEEVVPDGGQVEVGDVLKFEKLPVESNEVEWLEWDQHCELVFDEEGDSNVFCDPHYYVNELTGQWKENANPPESISCEDSNYVGGGWIDLTVNPPDYSLSQQGTAELSCNETGNVCEVLSAGSIEPVFQINETYGKFYHRTMNNICRLFSVTGDSDQDCICEGSDIAMADYTPVNFWSNDDPPSPYSTYLVNIPSYNISHNINATSSNNSPQDPIIEGPTEGEKENLIEFQISSSDPDGDDIRYGIDWNNDGNIDQWYPSSGMVTSGSIQAISYNWLTSGEKTFKAVVQDEFGNESSWSSHTINIICSPQSCSELGYECGVHDDGCGGEINCGTNCGSDSCDAWGDWYCADGNTRERARTCYNRGCSGGNCYETSYQDTEQIDCEKDGYPGKCIGGSCYYNGSCGSAEDEIFCDLPEQGEDNLCAINFGDNGEPDPVYDDAGGDKSQDKFLWNCHGWHPNGDGDVECEAERDCQVVPQGGWQEN